MNVLILGGYGNTGYLVAQILRQHTRLPLTIAGRDLKKAQDAAARLREVGGEAPVDGRRIDAHETATLRQALAGFDLVVVASSTTDHAAAVAEAALEAGCDYLDTQLSLLTKWAALRALAPRIEGAGRCFITDGGFHPGLPAALIRHAALHLSPLHSAQVGSVIQLDWRRYGFSDATPPELVSEISDFHPGLLSNGQWVESWRDRRFDFGPPFGERGCYPFALEEIRTLPALLPSLREGGFFVGGFNWFTDWVVLPTSLVALKVAPRAAPGPVGKLLRWSLESFSRPPYGVVLQVEARGLVEGQPRLLRVRLSHEDGYYFTAAPVAAAIMQLQRDRRPGLHAQGQYLAPAELLDTLRGLGIRSEVSWAPADGSAGASGGAT